MKRKRERRPFNKTRLKNQILNVVKNPFNMIVAISLVILFCLIVIPLLQMIASTFTLARAEAKRYGGEVGDFTLYYWRYILVGKLSGATLWGPLKNSLVVGFFTVIVSVPLGSILGWLMVRSDIPGKKLLGMLVVIPYMIPSWCKALAWLAVFRNKTSGSLGFLAGMGIPIPDWLAYGPVAIVLCMSLHYYAFSYIHVSSALRSINSELEEMGEICGANKVQILKSITLPLVLPSILSALVMTLSKSIGTYGVAANLGSRIGYFTLATKMKTFINGGPQGVGFAMSLVLISLAALIIFSNQRIIGVRKSYATIGGKGGRSNEMHLGGAKIPLMCFLVVFLFFAMVAPFMISRSHPLYSVSGVFNAIYVHGNMLGDSMYYGRGAGKLPTASAVVSDVVDCARHLGKTVMCFWENDSVKVADPEKDQGKFFVRVKSGCREAAMEAFGALAEINVGISEEFAFMTQVMSEEAFNGKIKQIGGCINRIRILSA